MIVVGDIASPNAACSADLKKIFTEHAAIFGNNSLVGNFEGLLCDEIAPDTNTPVLYNHSSVLDALAAANAKAVGLANNHTLDLPECFDNTVKALTKSKIVFSGAGKSKLEAGEPVSFFDNNTEIILFNYCWDFLLYHQQNPTEGLYVAEIDTLQLLTDIAAAKQAKSSAKIVVYLHWSFDLETLPFPMYRQMAISMIDAGANAVIGTHSHCVQGGEKYKDGYIIYGLGNFFLPYNTFANGKLTFPEFSRLQLAFDWNPATNSATCHWFYYDNSNGRHRLILKESAAFENSVLLKQFSPYPDLSTEAYVTYFKKNRRKKILVPVYTDYNAVFKNSMYTVFLKSRGRFARMLAKMKMRKWQS
ncbi:MAG: CapA family protein [Chitinophagaceae bacterium]|nr:CapA family protein [Chitinophagaceae bacterium]